MSLGGSLGRCGTLRAFAAVALLALAGCATPLLPSGGDWLMGRLALSVQASGGEPARQFSADFELRGDADSGQLNLTGPLGAQLAQARWGRGQAWLRTPQGERSFDSLASLSQQALGESLPLQALPDWLAGRPWPGAPSQPSSAGFEQLGWQVDLADLAAGRWLAQRSAPPTILLRVRLEGRS